MKQDSLRTVTPEYLRELSSSDFDAEAREILGNEAVVAILETSPKDQREALIRAIAEKRGQKVTPALKPHIKGKVPASGPDK